LGACSVADAQAALDMLTRGGRPDLLVTDFMMPGPMNGIALAEAARDVAPSTRVLLTTGYTELCDGALDGFPLLRKPYDTDTLRRAVADALGRR
jgi:Response regulator containing CheY-like receiver, AAA-type ATPase, and DNA-binding domains